MHLTAAPLSLDEMQALDRFGEDGLMSVTLYKNGVFSEPAFILYGVMERLVIRKRLSFLGRTGDQKNAAYHYAFPQTARALQAEMALTA